MVYLVVARKKCFQSISDSRRIEDPSQQSRKQNSGVGLGGNGQRRPFRQESCYGFRRWCEESEVAGRGADCWSAPNFRTEIIMNIFPRLKRTPLKRSTKRIKRGKPPKKYKPSTLKNKLDAAFSLMIRERDQDSPCISCRKNPGTQAGHFVRREILATRWHPKNVNSQCGGCNCFVHGNLAQYAVGLEEKWGAGTLQTLAALGRTYWKPSREALEQLLAAAKLGAESYQEIWEFYGSEPK